MELPQKFKEDMKQLLGEEYKDYLESFKKEPVMALRINLLKINPQAWEKINPFAAEKIPWNENGYFLREEKEADKTLCSKHPYYYAGLYYLQEPSAMLPASILPVQEGERVLDLCAAPGGKATELAARLQGTGILVANDISSSRAMALAKNLQLAGARNAVVTAERPEHLREMFPEYFDKILVDAPCSGEGMFRRDSSMLRDWMAKGPSYYQNIQKEILSQAYEMLRAGGSLVYSTCTFSVLEDEAVVQWFLRQHPDMEICPVKRWEGFAEGRPDLVENGEEALRHAVRIFPHRVEGEGHFVALLRKKGKSVKRQMPMDKLSAQSKKPGKGAVLETWQEELCAIVPSLFYEREKMRLQGDQIYIGGMDIPRGRRLRIIQNGLLAGYKKRRVEPSVQLALALREEEFPQTIDFAVEDSRVVRYLKGETLFVEEDVPGWVLLCVDGFPLGWCKASGKGVLKNKYYAGWRMQ